MEKQQDPAAPSGNVFVEAPKQLAKEATWLLRRCTKPNKKEYLKIVQAVVLGFLVMGFVGYFTKLIHIPINNIIGGKTRRRGKNDSKENDKRELIFKEVGQEYAQVVKMLGNGRLEASCFDGTTRLAQIRGSMRKKIWINQGDIILLSLREFQEDKADVIQKYTADEARLLKQYGELPDNAKINEGGDVMDGEGEDDDVEFDFDVDEI
ncbi:Translation initiation factor 1A [Coemansia spiralis]|uniref:Translation initiation factor 1A n=2 Tax=Coemansia TaxID=4863 RepID=A0A9W8G148_9FUNG|nr:Translation initiation factor 1A [Coemansia umbellata]KAJ2618695.1 Translation initiation factor 1A [Coemansia sp. RSA 1358]KAJ2668808.1 Translation initiation factor 1A [Coemansia spiralis]